MFSIQHQTSRYKHSVLIALLLLFLLPATVFAAQNSALDLIEIHDPWIRAPAPFAHALGGFMLIKNHSDIPVTLIQAKADGFDEVMLHQSINDNGMHTMEHAKNILIPAQGEMRFQHGSYHIMFMGLHKKIMPGDQIPVTLVFDLGSETGLEKHLSFIVRKPD